MRYIVIINDIIRYIVKIHESDWELISSPELFYFCEGYWLFFVNDVSRIHRDRVNADNSHAQLDFSYHFELVNGLNF